MPTKEACVRYLDEAYTLIERPVMRHGPLRLLPGQDANRHGVKIITDQCVKIHTDPRFYRVYRTRLPLVHTLWIIRQGQKLHLRS